MECEMLAPFCGGLRVVCVGSTRKFIICLGLGVWLFGVCGCVGLVVICWGLVVYKV